MMHVPIGSRAITRLVRPGFVLPGAATAAAVLLATAALLLAPRSIEPPASAQQMQGRRIEILFLGHASTHHNSGVYAPMLKTALAPQGFNISYTETPDALNPANLARYDALIIYANHDRITPDQEKALLDWVASGKGFLPIHSASFCFQNSEAFISLVGAQFQRHGTGVFSPTITMPSHEIMQGVNQYEAWDESYVHTKHNQDRTVLMERVDSEGREPWTWVRTHGRGRVFYTASGHDERVWALPDFQRMIRNAILWAVDTTVKQQWEMLNLQPLVYRQGEVPVPNYERRDPPPLYQEPLSTEEAHKHMQVPPGFELQLFAAEPDIVNPIAMTWDERGRLWVAETVDYPNDRQENGMGNDVIRILEDTDNDGRADKFTLFADKLSIPTGLVLVNGGVVVSQAPNFLFLADTTGDDRADVRRPIFDGWRTNDTHAGPSNLKYGFDNWLWGSVGYAGFRGTIAGEQRNFSQGIYRFQPDGSQLENITNFSNNTWGLGFSETFDVFGSTANNEHSVFVAIPNRFYQGVNGVTGPGRKKIDGHYAVHPNTDKIRQVDSQGGYTAAAGFNLYTARAYPQEYWNRIALVNEPTAHVLHHAILERDGAGFRELDGWNLMASDDEWMAPVHAEVGPDGAVWVLDWYHFIVQHNPTPGGAVAQGYGFETGAGAAYETPLRRTRHGRIYRVVWKDAPAYRPMSLSKDRPQELLQALRNDNMFWRMTAQRLLVERGQRDVLPQLYALVQDRSVDAVGLNGGAVHGLWTLHGLGVLDGSNAEALAVARAALAHPSAGVRKNAQMVLPNTQDRLGDRLGAAGLNDPDPSVQLVALLAVAELPSSREAGRALYMMSKKADVMRDEWRSEALYIAASRHAAGFYAAYAEEVGVEEFSRQAVRAARGDIADFVDMSAPDFDDSGWRNIRLPNIWSNTALAALEGSVWLRRTVDLPAEAAGQLATIRLGNIDDADITFINGKRIGSRPSSNILREYVVPESLLVAGRNVIAVRVVNNSGRGGVIPDSTGMVLSGNGFRIDLNGQWRHMVEERWRGRKPAVSASVPLAQQLLVGNSPLMGLVMADSAALRGVNVGDAFGRGRGRGGGGGGGRGGRGGGRGAAQPPTEPVALELALSVIPLENRFDRATITAKAGQRVRLNFNNQDVMAHNVVIIQRERLPDFEKELMSMLSDPTASTRGFIPDSRLIVASMPLVQSSQTGSVEFTAPAVPGDYPFVCTYPGHWFTMRGVLRVE